MEYASTRYKELLEDALAQLEIIARGGVDLDCKRRKFAKREYKRLKRDYELLDRFESIDKWTK